MVIQELARQDRIGVKIILIAFGSSILGDGVLQEDLGLFSLRLCLDHCKD